MNAAILSAGQSLRQTFDPDARFDVRIGVNSAVQFFHCDWWACGDAQTFARCVAIGYPVLFTVTESDSWFHRHEARLAKHRMVLWGAVRDRQHPPEGALDWSISAALALAVDLGAASVHVYGHDMSGDTDVSGHQLAARPANWKRVAAAWSATVAWAQERNVRLFEHRGV